MLISPTVTSDHLSCFRCKEVKPRSAFQQRADRRTGCTASCKQCTKVMAQLARGLREDLRERCSAMNARLSSAPMRTAIAIPELDLEETRNG